MKPKRRKMCVDKFWLMTRGAGTDTEGDDGKPNEDTIDSERWSEKLLLSEKQANYMAVQFIYHFLFGAGVFGLVAFRRWDANTDDICNDDK